jgi:hypothetical protein
MSELATCDQSVTFQHPVDGKTPLPTELRHIHRISEAEFAKALVFTYTPVAFGNVRVESLPDRDPQFGGFYLLCFHAHDGTGVLMDRDFWAGTVRFYAYGCAHRYRELTSAECRARDIYHGGRCFHVSECQDCGYINAVDSSD